MRRQSILKWMMIGTIASTATMMIAADTDPIGKKIDNTQIMDRVALIGVIAGGSPTTGVAVIKDTQTGRTYAIKTGDNLPGVGHIKLSTVQRELAVFDADGKQFQVRLSVGGYAQDAEDDDDLEADMVAEHEGPGLFEKWHGTGVAEMDLDQIHEGTDTVATRGQRRNDNANDGVDRAQTSEVNSNKKNLQSEIVVEVGDQGRTEEANNLRKDRDGPVNEFLNELTTSGSGENKLKSKIDAANSSKNKIKALNVNEGVRNSGAE